MRDDVRNTGKIGSIVIVLIVGLSFAWLAAPAPAAAVDADLLLRSGTIHDGSGAEPMVGDVAIRDGRIVAVGKVPAGKVARTIDCRGLIVAPGFIDLHTHTDGTLAQPGCRASLNYVMQGCTTMCTGNCGGSKNVAKFLNDVDTNGAGTNIMHLVGQGTIRGTVLGSNRRAPTAEELERMKALVDQAMRDGAWGMSTGLIYAPSSFAQTDELVALVKVVAAHGGIYASHIRDEGDYVLAAVDEAISIGRQSGAPVHISHFKSMQIPNWGRIRDAAAKIEKARAAGLTITADQYPYTANSFSLANATLPDARVRWSRADLTKRMESEPEFNALVRRVIADELSRTQQIDIAASKKFPKYVGKSLKEIAAEENIDQVDLVLKILVQESPQIVSHSMSEEDVRWAMTLPWVATASDGAARTQNSNEHHHPRNFGTFARKIGHYAIEENVLSLPQAIRSATGLPADIFGISERGYLRPGYHADIVVFDPATYRDQATFAKPQEYATGVRYVFTNGQAAVDEGKPSSKLFGRALRHQSAKTGDADNAASFNVQVEADEIVCELPAYNVTNNGSGMFWSSGSTQMVRVGDRLFVSVFEAVPGAAPLNNARWALYERRPDGWKLCQRDMKDRTREPCSLATCYDGRLMMSVNPTLAPLLPSPAKAKGGPARPEFLEFDSAHPEREPRHLVPQWSEAPKFTEHSYRAFSSDGKNGEFVLFNKVGTSQTAWAFLDRKGEWKTGLLTWPKGENPKYSVWGDEFTPVNYANAIVSDRQVHYLGQSPINIWNRIDPSKTETWGRNKWGWRMRKLHYAWTPDIKTEPFRDWIVLDDTMDDGGTVGLGDSWLAPDGRLHVVWQKEPIHPRLRDTHFPDIKRDWRMCYGVLKDGKILQKRVLLAGGETTGPLRPTGCIGHPRFHITPDHTMYVLCNLIGATAETRSQTGTYALRIESDGSVSAPVRVPLARHIPGTFFTATPRAGNRLTETADLLIADTVEGKSVARYSRIRFSPAG